MTIETTSRIAVYRGNGSTTSWPWNFRIDEPEHLSVSLQDFATGELIEVLPPGSYTAIGFGDDAGGVVEYPISGDPILDDTNIILLRTVPLTQEMSISPVGGFNPKVLEQQLDHIVMQIQQLAEVQGRAITVPLGQEGLEFAGILEDGDTLMIEDGKIVPGPDASQIEAAQGYAEQTLEAFNSFDTRYLGAKDSDPVLDNQGNPLIEGALYWNTPAGKFRVFHLGAWEDYLTVPDNSVTNVKLADMASGTLKGRASAGTGDPEDLTAEQVRELLDLRAHIERWDQIPYPQSVVDDTEYSHFGALKYGYDRFLQIYKQGPQHDTSHATGVALSQKPAAGGVQNLVINGAYASGGVATPPAATKVEILSDANDSGRTFTIYGTVNGSPDSEVIAGPAASYTTAVVTTKVFSTVTQVSVDANTAGNIRVGFFMVPQDVCGKWSITGGQTWSPVIKVFDGVTDVKCYYYGVLGTLRNESFIAMCTEYDIPTQNTRVLRKVSRDGEEWSEAVVVNITGDVPAVCAFFDDIERTPSGRLVVGVYDGSNSYVMVSDDEGLNWESRLLITDGATQYSEITIGIIDELRWIAMIRIDNVAGSLLQFKTEDGSASAWTNMGQTNMPISGGYKSHDLAIAYVNGTSYVVLTYMARQTASNPAPNVNSMCLRFVPSESALIAATAWSREYVVVPSSHILDGYTAPASERSLAGYPSLAINRLTGKGLLGYGRETAYYHAAQVETKAIDIAAMINEEWQKPLDSVRIEDDVAIKIGLPLPAGELGFGLIAFGGIARTALFTWDTIGTYEMAFLVEGSAASTLSVTTGPLTGTTGTDTHFTISIDSSGYVYVENRTGNGGDVTLQLFRGKSF